MAITNQLMIISFIVYEDHSFHEKIRLKQGIITTFMPGPGFEPRTTMIQPITTPSLYQIPATLKKYFESHYFELHSLLSPRFMTPGEKKNKNVYVCPY